MATLSGSEFAELRNLYESVYTQTEVQENVDLSDEEFSERLGHLRKELSEMQVAARSLDDEITRSLSWIRYDA